MPNFTGSRFGLLSRVALTRCPERPLYGIERDGVHIDAIPIAYDTMAFVDRFVERWPEGSSAHQSYFRRIVEGPDHTIEAATARPVAAALAV